MIDGVQWTALWYREGELVFFETQPWDGGTGGLGFTNWEPVPEQWMPGNYQVQIFVGLEAKAVGDFVVTGVPVTRTPTPSLTPAATISPTITLSPTPFPTLTRTVSPTPYPTQTRTPVTPSITPQPTQTRTVTPTPWPTATQ
jgi:type VI secretion system secreted protein VgrG